MFHPADILINALPASVKVVGRLSESDVQQLKEHPKEHKQTVSSPKDRVEQPPLVITFLQPITLVLPNISLLFDLSFVCVRVFVCVCVCVLWFI